MVPVIGVVNESTCDATSDEVLERAGVKPARSLVTVAASDADNLYITTSARLLSDQMRE